MIKRIIFDVDNTLITNVDFKNEIKRTLNEMNLYSEERNKIFEMMKNEFNTKNTNN